VTIAVAVIALVSLHPGTDKSPSHATSPAVLGVGRITAQALDPRGGLPWGLRTIQTQRLQGCLRLGRLRAGEIGALGQDGAFANDGRFHPIALDSNFPCGQTDAHGNLFLSVLEQGVPASASLGSTAGCQIQPPKGQPPLPHPRKLPVCPSNDLRNVAYGVLGPDAVSITYLLDGHEVTEPTGPDGAYLAAVPGSAQLCTFDAHGRKNCFSGSGGAESTTPTLQSGIITSVKYRDGRVCRLQTITSGSAGEASCPNIGYAHYPPFHAPQVTAAQLATTVTPSFTTATRFCYRPQKGVFLPNKVPCDHAIPPGYKVGMSGQRTLLIHLSFVAPFAADNHRSVYEFSLGRASGPSCPGSGGGVSATTMLPIRAGQHVVLQDNQQPCAGTYQGLITYQPNGGPGNDTLYWASAIHDHSTLVGRFTFVVR